MKHTARWTLAWPMCVLGVGLLFAIACTTPAIPNDIETRADPVANEPTESPDATTASGEGTTSNGSASAPIDAATAPEAEAGPLTGPCASEKDQKDCYKCCDEHNPLSIKFLWDAYDECQCETPGLCKSACSSSYCDGHSPSSGDACDKCLDANDGTCSSVATKACAANVQCKQLYVCDDTSGCAAKPKK